MNKNLKVLDCTIRDGGYYNNWDFTDDAFRHTIYALIESGVDLIELGYKSLSADQFYGPYKYCDESFLESLDCIKSKSVEFACMLDAKEFIGNIKVMDIFFPSKSQVLFSTIRLACSVSIIEDTLLIAKNLKEKGFQVCLNLMGISLLSDDELIKVLKSISVSIDVIYFADSFGNLYPKDVSRLIEIFRSTLNNQKIGFHPHDNLGLAFANSIQAIDDGIDYIDGTLLGMGRGAGNLKIEQLLIYLKFEKKCHQYSSYPLIQIIEDYYIDLQKEYQWGFDVAYMLSGIKNTHQSYCQILKSDNRYNYQEIFNILSKIEETKRPKYNQGALSMAQNAIFSSEVNSNIDQLKRHNSKDILIVANGPSVKNSQQSIKSLIEQKKPLLIECNYTGFFNDYERYSCVINSNKIKEMEKVKDQIKRIITPLENIGEIFSNTDIISIGYKIENKLNFSLYPISISSYLVGPYAIMVALSLGIDNLYLAGFDGFVQNNEEKNDMEIFFDKLNELPDSPNIYSITKTRYNVNAISALGIIQNETIQGCYTCSI